MMWLNQFIARAFAQSSGGPETAPSELWAELCRMSWPTWGEVARDVAPMVAVCIVFAAAVSAMEHRLYRDE